MNSTNNFDKCLYELLNYNDIDEDTLNKLEEVEIDDFKDQRIKKIIYKKINYKRRTGIYAATIILFLSFFTISFSDVAFASSIKHSINTIIKELKGDFSDYDTYSTYINTERKDKNVNFTIDKLSSDGNQIYISFTINSEKDINTIIDNPSNLSIGLKVDGEDPLAYGYSQNGKMVDKNNYSGILSVDISKEALANTFYLDMTINSIDQIKGLWDFKLKVDKRNIVSNTKTYNINKNISIQNTNFKVETIESNPVSTIVKIDGKLHNFFLLDDKGRLIKEKSGDSNDKETKLTFKSLIDKGTKSLTFIPYKFGEDYNNFKPEVYDIKPTPFDISQSNFGTITINELIWTKDELRINYTTIGRLPVIQSEGIYLLDDKGNIIIEENRFNTQISQDNQKDFYMIFKGVSKDKKYRIASSRLDKFYNIDEASKFTIDLK